MKISTSLGHAMKIEGVDARESARMMKLAGFDAVDVNMTYDMMEKEKVLSPEWTERVLGECTALKAEGLEIAQCHLPYYPGHLPLPGDDRPFHDPRQRDVRLADAHATGCLRGVELRIGGLPGCEREGYLLRHITEFCLQK